MDNNPQMTYPLAEEANKLGSEKLRSLLKLVDLEYLMDRESDTVSLPLLDR